LKEFAYKIGLPPFVMLNFFLESFPGKSDLINDSMVDEILELHDHKFALVALQVCWDGMVSGLMEFHPLIRDSLTKDLQELGYSRRPRVDSISFPKISTVFSLQVLADFHEVMGTDIGRPAELMRIRLKMAKDARQFYGQFVNTIELPKFQRDKWSKFDEQTLRGLAPFLDCIAEKGWTSNRQLVISQLSEEERPSKRLDTKYPLYSQNPVLCGLSTLAAQLQDHQYTTMIADDKWWNICSICHLYNVLRTQSFITFEWKLMEAFISAYTPEFVFCGGRPTTLSECVKKLKLAMGQVLTPDGY
jgi:hypothetical protein